MTILVFVDDPHNVLLMTFCGLYRKFWSLQGTEYSIEVSDEEDIGVLLELLVHPRISVGPGPLPVNPSTDQE